jgi:hypothetical protein
MSTTRITSWQCLLYPSSIIWTFFEMLTMTMLVAAAIDRLVLVTMYVVVLGGRYWGLSPGQTVLCELFMGRWKGSVVGDAQICK